MGSRMPAFNKFKGVKRAADQYVEVAHAGGMFGGDLAGVGRTAAGGELDVDGGITLAECIVQCFAQLGARGNAGDDFAFLLGGFDGLVPFRLGARAQYRY